MVIRMLINRKISATLVSRNKSFGIWLGLWIGLVGLAIPAVAQQTNEVEAKPGVAVIARPLQDSILLRWGATSPISWQLSNQYGYMIERVTILRNFKLLPTPEKRIITPSPIKPWPMAQWEALVDQDDHAGVAAQALFGETFEITENFGNDMMQVVNKARETEMRYSFAMFAADQSLTVSKASGLYYVDKNIKEGEKYLYRVYSLVPRETLPLDTGYVYVGTMDYAELPPPTDMNARLEAKRVELSWNRENFDGIYNSYNLERSADGRNFKKINDKPIVNAFSGDAPKSRYMYRLDSLPEYNVKYYYRVRGLTPFGEVGPPSDTATVTARVNNTHNPVIIEKENLDNTSIGLKWEFDAEHQDRIESFSVLRTPNPKLGYDTIASDISPATRDYVDTSPEIANYYIVAAKDYAGGYQYSLPALAQLVDSIPPVAPTGLTGSIDTTGIVTLVWTPNQEKDMWGYRVYRANYEDEEYSQLTIEPVAANAFYDTIPLRNLTKQIYYKILAVDKRSNGSEFSEPVKLIKPDLVPPVAPVIAYVESTAEGVKLDIIPSSSEDVVSHFIYRKTVNQVRWDLVQQFDSLTSKLSFTDTTLNDYKTRSYTVIAVDASGLESPPARSVEAKKIDKGLRDEIKNIYAEANRESRFISLEWQYEKQGVDRFLIYKSYGDQGFRLYKTLPADQRSFIDKTLKINTVYKYRIMAVYTSGARSPFSKEIEVNY
ncbi:MAG: hypothetical protein AAFX87_00855 [Bacteroidota bacterium]